MKINISHVLTGIIIAGLAGSAYCQDNRDKAREYYQKGNDYYQQGKYQEAEEEFKKALDIVSQKEESEPVRLTLPEPAAAKSATMMYCMLQYGRIQTLTRR
jgi:tetratricopeptide (TPR) repeat protein